MTLTPRTPWIVRCADTNGELTSIRTRVDTLYVTVTSVTTVGFGDVHAVGQLSRVLVTGRMEFDVAFIAAFGGFTAPP